MNSLLPRLLLAMVFSTAIENLQHCHHVQKLLFQNNHGFPFSGYEIAYRRDQHDTMSLIPGLRLQGFGMGNKGQEAMYI